MAGKPARATRPVIDTEGVNDAAMFWGTVERMLTRA